MKYRLTCDVVIEGDFDRVMGKIRDHFGQLGVIGNAQHYANLALLGAGDLKVAPAENYYPTTYEEHYHGGI